MQLDEEALMQGLCMFSRAREPGADGGLSVAEDSFGRRRVQSFGEGREYHGDEVREGFPAAQGRVAPGSERGTAGLAAKRLDVLGLAMRAIANQRMDVSVCDPEVQILLIGTGEACCMYALGCSPSAFHLSPGTHWCKGRFHA